jgi:nitrate/nitrite-specific signal transduction histidine kinase
MKNKQLRSLKKAIDFAENDISSKYTIEEIRYMKTRYRQLREYITFAQKMQNNGFGLNIPDTVVPEDGPKDEIDNSIDASG